MVCLFSIGDYMTNLTAWNKIKSCVFTFKSKKQRGASVQVDFTNALDLPIVFNPVLDETLNTAQIVLSDLRRKDYENIFSQHGIDVTKAFEQMSIVRVKFQKPVGDTFVDQRSHIDMFISHDDCRMERKSEGQYRSYIHNIKLIEFTKELERESVDTLTFTNPIPRQYDAQSNIFWNYTDGFTRSFAFGIPGGRIADLSGSGEHFLIDYCGWQPPDIPMLLAKQDNYLLSDNLSKVNVGLKEPSTMYVRELTLTITTPSNRIYNYSSPLAEDHRDGAIWYYKDSYIPIQINEVGEYKIDIRIQTYTQFQDGIGYRLCEFYYSSCFAVNSTEKAVQPYKFNESIERLLNVTPTRLLSEGSKYVFNKSQLDEYSGEESPEFAFTNHTLFEALYQMSSYKGSFPELDIGEQGDRTVSFRTMWNGVRLTEEELPPPVDDISSSDIEQYCTHIETSVQNLVGVNNSQIGTLTEPYKNGWKSTRSSGGSAITQDTAIIPTEYNMYLHIGEKFGIVYDGGMPVYDITPYIYESGDYEALSDYNGSYPSSKGYALKWSQMGANIGELAHRINSSASNLAKAFTQPAISNIIQAKSGIKYGSGVVEYISSLLNLKNDNKYGFSELLFRTQYIPVINARVKQYKENFSDFAHPGSIKYNQTAELVDSEMYGEHLKELMRKLGNRVFQKTYTFNSLDDVPEVGTLVGDYSIYDIKMSIRENRVNATISFVRYAELSQFIGVKNAWKDSDVSIDKCYERQISYNEFLLFTHDSTLSGTSKAITRGALNNIMPKYYSNTITCVQATGYTKEGDKMTTVLLPVVSLAIGNSVLFHWKYQNNYSAGYMSQKAPSGATSATSGTAYDRAQQAVKYADSYGRLESLSYSLMTDGPTASGSTVWIEDDSVEDRLYPYEVTSTINEGLVIVNIEKSIQYPVNITVRATVKCTTTNLEGEEIEEEREYTGRNVIPVGSTGCNISFAAMIVGFKEIKSINSTEAIYNGIDITAVVSDVSEIARIIAHSLPLKDGRIKTMNAAEITEWRGDNLISVDKVLVEKNSSEAITCDTQIHFVTDITSERDGTDFIIGSGFSNFCPLVGGSSYNFGVYGFRERINIFSRHISLSGADYITSSLSADIISRGTDALKITLPAGINAVNDDGTYKYKAWAYVGRTDAAGSYQIIFGENKGLGEDIPFNTVVYALPMHKIEDII